MPDGETRAIPRQGQINMGMDHGGIECRRRPERRGQLTIGRDGMRTAGIVAWHPGHSPGSPDDLRVPKIAESALRRDRGKIALRVLRVRAEVGKQAVWDLQLEDEDLPALLMGSRRRITVTKNDRR